MAQSPQPTAASGPGANVPWPDIGLCLVLMALSAVFADFAWAQAHGLIPDNDQYYGSDTALVVSNLFDPRSDFRHSNVHPLVGVICLAFQKTALPLLGPRRGLELLAVFDGVAFAAAMFATLRAWKVDRWLSAASVVLACGMASYVCWVAMPERHFLAGVTVLIVIAMASRIAEGPIARLVQSAAMFTLSFSLVATDVAIWGLAQVRYASLWERRFRQFVTENLAKAPEWALAGLAGIGLTAVVQAVVYMANKNTTVGPLLHMWEETRWIVHGWGPWWGGLDIIGAFARRSALALPGNALLAAAMVWATWRLRKGPVFIPLFALTGLVFHSAYDRAEAFLFSPDHGPAVVVALVLALGGWRPRATAAAFVLAGLVLGAVNVQAYRNELSIRAPRSRPVESIYAAMSNAPVGDATAAGAVPPGR